MRTYAIEAKGKEQASMRMAEEIQALSRQKEDHLRLVIDTIPTMAWSVRPDGVVDFLNKRWVDYSGLTLERYVQDPTGPIHPEDIPRVLKKWRAAMAAGESSEDEMRLRRADGEYRWFLVRTVPLRDEQGKIVKWYGTSADIEDRKRAEDALRESEEKFRQLSENIREVFWMTTPHLEEVLYVAPDYERVWVRALESERQRPQSFMDAIHSEDRERVVGILEGQRQQGFEVECRIVRPDGSVRWIRDRGFPVKDASGKVYRIAGVAEDITERKRIEMALQKNEHLLSETQVLGRTGSWEHNLVTGEIANTEGNLRLFFGDDRSKGARFDDFAEVVHQDDREYVGARHAQLLTEGGPRDIEYRVVWPDGSVHVLFGRATVVRDAAGRPLRVYGTNVDITERKRAENALRDSGVRLQALSRRLVELQESERKELARELHDRVGQSLTALKINIDILQPALASQENAEVLARVADSAALLEATMDTIENVMSELRPPMLDDHGLAAALDWHARNFSRRTGIAVAVRAGETAGRPALQGEIGRAHV